MNIPEWVFYLGAFISFWVGYFTSAMLSSSKEEDIRAAILGELGRKTEGKLIQGDAEDSHTKSETLVVGEILERKRTPSRRTQKDQVRDKTKVQNLV